MLESTATGQPIWYSCSARRMLDTFFSNSNSGEWTPTITRPSARYLSHHWRRNGKVRWQLMHEYVQKSTSTTLPRSASIESGGELSQSTMPVKSGASGPVAGSDTCPVDDTPCSPEPP